MNPSYLPQPRRITGLEAPSGMGGGTSGSVSSDDFIRSQSGQQGQISTGQPQESGWQKLLPTIGSIAAPVVGAALAPATGGASLLAGSLLSALGAGGGKALENVLTGQEATKGVGQEALLSGGSALAFGGAGKMLGKIGKKAAPALEKTAAKTFVGQAEKGAIAPETGSKMIRYGFKSPKEATQLGSVVSGSLDAKEGSILTKGLSEALDQYHSAQPQKYIGFADFEAPRGVKAAGRRGVMSMEGRNNFIDQALIDSGLSEDDALRKQAQQYFNRATQGQKKVGGKIVSEPPTIGGKITPSKALQAQKDYASEANQFREAFRRSNNTTDLNKANFWGKLDSEMKTRLGINADALDTAIPISQAEKTSLASRIRQTGVKGAQQFADELESNPEIVTWAQVRQLESPFAEIGQAVKQTAAKGAKGFGITVPDIAATALGVQAGGPVGGLGAFGLTKALESPVAAEMVTGGLSKAAQKAATGKLPDTLTRMGVLGGGVLGTIPGWAGQANMTPTGGTTGMQGQGMGGMQSGTQPMMPPVQNLYNTMYGQYLAGGPAATGASNLASVLAGLAPQAQLTNELGRLTGVLGAAYGGAGGPQGLLGGLGALTTGFIPGSPANLYNRQQEAVSQLRQLLYGIPSQAGRGIMPQLTQSPGTASLALQNLGL